VDEEAARLPDAATWRASGVMEANQATDHPLTITAGIVPIACTPTVGSNGAVNLGRIPSQRLDPEQVTVLTPHTLSLQVACDAPARFALRVQDDRQGSAIHEGDTYFGLGHDSGGHRIGSFRLGVDSEAFHADHQASLLLTTSGVNTTTWAPSRHGQAWLGGRELVGFTHGEGDTSGPDAIQNLQGTLALQATLAPAQDLDLRSEVEIDGHVTLEIIYL